jgi:branched-subunit amino acid ABC-type transport system permease component
MDDPTGSIETWLPTSWAEAVVWVAIVAVIVGLYLLLRRTRRASRAFYLDPERREDEMRRDDPDMK